jgi:hypothetical protein
VTATPKASTNTANTAALNTALEAIPDDIRRRIIEKYVHLRGAYADGNFDAAGLRAGIFAETVLRFLQHHLTGTYTPFGSKLPVFHDECRRLEKTPSKPNDEGVRVIMPRALDVLYTLRNKRGIGHAGGDVEANEIDAATCVRVADWCMCELVRVFHTVSLEEAQAILDAIAVRQLPNVWAVNGKHRVLSPGMTVKDQVLLLLHGTNDPAVPAEDLCDWVEYSELSKFRTRVLRPLHAARLVEFDAATQTVVLSPTGAAEVERRILANPGR